MLNINAALLDNGYYEIAGKLNSVIDDDDNLTEYEPLDLPELDPEQVATNMASLMNDLQITLEPKDINEICGEPMLCQMLLDQNEHPLEPVVSDQLYFPDIEITDYSDNEYDDYDQYHPL